MSQPGKFTAALSRDGTLFLMQTGRWRSGWTQISELDAWIALYRGLRDRLSSTNGRGRYHDIYAPAVTALEAIKKKLKEAAN